MDAEKIPRIDETPEADAAEQRTIVFDEGAGLDASRLADIGDCEANEADVIDQATAVPIPDEDEDADLP